MGAYKPHFASVPDDYYPTSACDIILVVLVLLIVIGGTFGILVGFLFWNFIIGNPLFVLIWSIVFAAFFVAISLAIFFGGFSKLRHEKVIIRQKLRQLQESAARGELQPTEDH